MPIYPDLNLVYVHIPKTAGGAIEELLEPWKAPGPKTLFGRLRSRLPFRQDIRHAYIPGHATAAELQHWMGAEAWARARSFAVVRDPYARIISEYEYVRQTPTHHRHERAKKMDFADYIAGRKLDQASFLTDARGKLLVNRILHFENLHGDLNALLAECGLNVALPERGSRNSSRKAPQSTYLTPRAIRLINDGAAADFDLLGYARLDADAKAA